MSVTATPSRVREAAIALNNVGVSLLERRRYRQAMDTFKDSIDIMKQSILTVQVRTTTTTIPSTESKWSDLEIDETLNKASRFLAGSSSPTHYNEKDVTYLNALSDDMSAEAILAISQQVGCIHHSSPYALRILTNSDMFMSHFDVDSALILFNYGVACRLYSKESSCQEQSSRALHAASKLFHLSHGVLSQISLDVLEETDYYKFLLISMLVLENLIQICTEFDLSEQGEIYYDQLSILQIHLSEQLRPQSSIWECMARNPAAAA